MPFPDCSNFEHMQLRTTVRPAVHGSALQLVCEVARREAIATSTCCRADSRGEAELTPGVLIPRELLQQPHDLLQQPPQGTSVRRSRRKLFSKCPATPYASSCHAHSRAPLPSKAADNQYGTSCHPVPKSMTSKIADGIAECSSRCSNFYDI